MSTPTPRTDRMMKFCFGDDRAFVRVEDALELERELEAHKAAMEMAEKALHSVFRHYIPEIADHDADGRAVGEFCGRDLHQANKALQAIAKLKEGK